MFIFEGVGMVESIGQGVLITWGDPSTALGFGVDDWGCETMGWGKGRRKTGVFVCVACIQPRAGSSKKGKKHDED